MNFFALYGKAMRLVIAAVLSLWVALGVAQTPLTLQDAQRIAVDRSRALAAKDAAISASREMAIAAAQLPDPMAKLQLNNLPVTGEDRFSLTRDFMTMRSVGVAQEFTRAEKRQARAERFERDAEKSLAERTANVGMIQRDAAIAWLDRYYTQAMLDVVGEQTRQAHLEIEAADTAYRAGRGNLADVLAARSALTALDDRTSELERRITTAKIALARWVGDAAETPLAGQPAIDTIALDLRTLDTDLAHHPDIAVLAKQEAVAAAEVRIARANKQPDWSLELMYNRRGPAFSDMISIGVSVPLQWDQKNRQDREVAAKLAMVEQARAERDDMLRAHTAEVRAMIAEWQNSGERIARYQRELVPLATERTQATLAAYRGAKSSITDVLMARRNEIDIRVQALQLATDRARLWAQINFLIPVDQATVHQRTLPGKDSR